MPYIDCVTSSTLTHPDFGRPLTTQFAKRHPTTATSPRETASPTTPQLMGIASSDITRDSTGGCVAETQYMGTIVQEFDRTVTITAPYSEMVYPKSAKQ